MKQHQFGRYLTYSVLAIFGLLLVVIAINWFVNPHGIYDSPMIEGFNALKPEANRMTKAYAVKRIKPRAICLGNSSAEIGIDPDHPGWSCAPVYNLALQGGNIYEMTRYLQHANAVQPLKEVVLMLDFFAFSSGPIVNAPDVEEDRLAITYNGEENAGFNIEDTLATLFSKEALFSSINTLVHQQKADAPYLQNGMENPTAVSAYFVRQGNRAVFPDLEVGYLESLYRSTDQYPFEITETNCVSFSYYRKILQLAYQNNIQLHICISPFHVRMWEVLGISGQWTRFELLKRMLVVINEEEALHANKPPFPLWDFGVYNEFTTEDVPPIGDTKTTMQWYWDSVHYKKELGDIMLDRIFGCVKVTGASYNDFGVLLTSKNIDEHLLKIRTDRQHYRDTHPDDIAEIEALAKKLGRY